MTYFWMISSSGIVMTDTFENENEIKIDEKFYLRWSK